MSEITNKELAESLNRSVNGERIFHKHFWDYVKLASERLAAMPDEIEPWKDGWTDWYTGSDGWSHIKTDCLKLHLESIESQSQPQQPAPDKDEFCSAVADKMHDLCLTQAMGECPGWGAFFDILNEMWDQQSAEGVE